MHPMRLCRSPRRLYVLCTFLSLCVFTLATLYLNPIFRCNFFFDLFNMFHTICSGKRSGSFFFILPVHFVRWFFVFCFIYFSRVLVSLLGGKIARMSIPSHVAPILTHVCQRTSNDVPPSLAVSFSLTYQYQSKIS